MASLKEIVTFCDQHLRRTEIKDFEGAYNGLQIENNGSVSKIGASVDAGQRPFEDAIAQGVDFIICHHGMFWTHTVPIVGTNYMKVKTAFDGNLAIYGAHLPLDCHPDIGNNALLADALGLNKVDTFLNYEGSDMAIVVLGPNGGREELTKKLRALFPESYQAIEYGSAQPKRIGILTGSGQSAVPRLLENGIDTLITGELRQHHFNMAQELRLNLYPCGHYATEIYGVKALTKEVAQKFKLPWAFIEQPCPL